MKKIKSYFSSFQNRIIVIRVSQLVLLLLFAIGCKNSSPNEDDSGSLKRSEDKATSLKQVDGIDTSAFVRIVADDILQRLQDWKWSTRKSHFDEKGDYYIEYNADTSNAAADDIIWEYYLVEREHLITGKLNADDKPDFALRTFWGLTMGNMYGIEWHVYSSQKNGYKQIENDFGGGKFSDMESVIAIDNMKLETEFQKLDDATSLLSDSMELRTYELVKTKLKRKK